MTNLILRESVSNQSLIFKFNPHVLTAVIGLTFTAARTWLAPHTAGNSQRCATLSQDSSGHRELIATKKYLQIDAIISHCLLVCIAVHI
jgi:hypothetical protein